MALTAKQRRFVEEYCADFNGAAAARRAGYSKRTAKQTAYELLRKPEIAEAVEQRMNELSMSAAEVTLRLTNMGRGTLAPFLGPDGKSIDLGSEEAQSNLHLLKKVKIKDDEVAIEIHDPKDAVIQLGKIRGLYKDESLGNALRELLVRDVDEVDAG